MAMASAQLGNLGSYVSTMTSTTTPGHTPWTPMQYTAVPEPSVCLTALLFLLPAVAFSEEIHDPEMELGGNLFLINREHPIGKDYYPRDLVEPKVLGGGEAGPEAVVGVSSLMDMIQTAVNNNMPMADSGDITIPVYIGGNLIDEMIVSAEQRRALRSGGRA